MTLSKVVASPRTQSAVATASTTLIRGGMEQLHQYFLNERERFTSSPILLLVNHYPPNPNATISTSKQMKIQMNAIQQIQYLLQQKLGYSTLIASCGKEKFASSSSTSEETPSTANTFYPTQFDIDNAMQLSQYIGAYNIVALGTGNVMDVGKSIYNTYDMYDELLCIPTTYTASMVAMSSHALFYDTHEDTLIPKPDTTSTLSSSSLGLSTESSSRHQYQTTHRPRPKSIFSVNDELDFDTTTNLFDTTTDRHITLLALLSIILDNIYQKITLNLPMSSTSVLDESRIFPGQPKHSATQSSSSSSVMSHLPNEYVRIIDMIMSCMDKKSSSSSSLFMQQRQQQHEQMLNICYAVGNYISYGLPITNDVDIEIIHPRSLPIAMVASLSSSTSNTVSNAFAQYTATTIMASFVSSYCELIIDQINSRNTYTNTEATSHEKKLLQYCTTILQNEQQYNVPKIITTESVLSLISKIQTNQLIWNCYSNYNDEINYTKLFQHHLLM